MAKVTVFCRPSPYHGVSTSDANTLDVFLALFLYPIDLLELLFRHWWGLRRLFSRALTLGLATPFDSFVIFG